MLSTQFNGLIVKIIVRFLCLFPAKLLRPNCIAFSESRSQLSLYTQKCLSQREERLTLLLLDDCTSDSFLHFQNCLPYIGSSSLVLVI